jgi:hypothetical protein
MQAVRGWKFYLEKNVLICDSKIFPAKFPYSGAREKGCAQSGGLGEIFFVPYVSVKVDQNTVATKAGFHAIKSKTADFYRGMTQLFSQDFLLQF